MVARRKAKRILIAKGGLDGHTRGIEMLSVFLRDAGFEVVYLGPYQAPEAIFTAAVQEDVDIVGVSVHSGGHKSVFRDLMRMFAKTGEEWVVAAGGIIPPNDHAWLKTIGVRYVFPPGTSIKDEIIPAFQELDFPREERFEDLYEGLSRGNRRALAKFITHLCDGASVGYRRIDEIPSHVVGFTGGGGVGKSSLVEHLVKHVYRERRVAALFVDPPALSGGVFLGDRVRLHRPETLDVVTSPNVFVRSIAARKVWKGVTEEIPSVIRAFGDAGYDTVILESVGSGQYDLGFKEQVHTMVLAVSPDMGDEIQMMKGGVAETADIIVVNKADRPGVDTTGALLKRYFSKKRKDGWTIPVISTNASPGRGEGIEKLWKAISEHRRFLGK